MKTCENSRRWKSQIGMATVFTQVLIDIMNIKIVFLNEKELSNVFWNIDWEKYYFMQRIY